MAKHPARLWSTGSQDSGRPRDAAPDDQPLDPGAALNIVRDTGRSARRQLNGHAALVYLLWALTWIVGYGALQGSREGWLPIEPAAALAVLGAGLAVAALAAGPDHFLAVFLYLGSAGLLAGSLTEHLATRRLRPAASHA